jgi:hypothetical protein
VQQQQFAFRPVSIYTLVDMVLTFICRIFIIVVQRPPVIILLLSAPTFPFALR